MTILRTTSRWRVCAFVVCLLRSASCNINLEQQIADVVSLKSQTRTPLSSPEECIRECQANEAPKICYYQFTLENYMTVGGACVNGSNSVQCVPADGVDRSFLSINRMLPGPMIYVCDGDKVVVDVYNKIQGQEVTIHWHGIYQRETPYYDGVPFVTQCPIPQATTFRYQFITNRGTQFYHSHSGIQKLDGLHGALIVRQAASEDPSSSYYDIDSPDHVIELADWMHESAVERFPGRYTNDTGGAVDQDPDNLLVNGLGKYTNPRTGVTTNSSYAVFHVEYGKRYRFRMIGSLSTVCPVQVSIENHTLLVIAADGEPVLPVVVNSIEISSGERYDFVVTANQTAMTYWIQVRGIGECQAFSLQQLAILHYEGTEETPASPPPTYAEGMALGVVLNPVSSNCNGSDPNKICVSQLRNAEEVDPRLLKKYPDVTIYIDFRFNLYTPAQLYVRGQYITYLVNDQLMLNSLLDEIMYALPPSPLYSQREDIPAGEICTYEKRPARCSNLSQPCSCVHVLKVKKGVVCEVVIADIVPVPVLNHPFHLHGYSYYVLGMGQFPNMNVTAEDIQRVWDLDRQELLANQSYRPPGKDTLVVPSGGYTIVRFVADNPGYWFYHCHFMYHIAIGMNFVLQVGNKGQMPPVPATFPRCGNYLPPIKAP